MKKYLLLSLIFLLIFITLKDADSIPAFARKYNMSCNVCHSPFPRVKPYGEDFAGNGFQLPDKEPSRFYKKTGDDLLMLMKELPLAMRIELFGQYDDSRDNNPDFRTPYNLKIMSGGNIFKDISYYFYFFFSERGEVAGIEDAFLMFNNVLSNKVDFDIYAGQFQVSDPLFKRELRLEQEDYKIYTTTPGRSHANLKYDRGLMLTYAAPTNTDLILEVINGSGIDTKDVFDLDKYKNIMFRASQEITSFFRIGGFGYYGKEELGGISNELFMAGGDLTAGNDKIELNAQYVYRSDLNPEMAPVKPGKRILTQGGFAELLLMPHGDKSRIIGSLLYNYVDSDFGVLRYQSMTGGLSYLLARNLRLIGEYTYIKDSKTSKVTLGIVSAF